MCWNLNYRDKINQGDSLIAKILKSFYHIFNEIFSRLGFPGIKRLFSILRFGLKISFYIWLDHKNLKEDGFLFFICSKVDPLLRVSREERDSKRAKWLLDEILHHGTTFIKLGQILATRADLIPLPYMKELARLQDDVPPFDNDLAFQTITSELKRPITSIFSEIDPIPIASASLGQVYRGKFLDIDKDIIIKVQRPDLKRLIEEDVFILKIIAKEIEKYPALACGNDYSQLLDEFLRVLNEEIDYIQEGKNCDQFRKNFQGYYELHVPKVYWQYTTRKVITLEHVHGWKVTEKEKIINAGFSVNEITKEGSRAYLKQLLTDGFFHADPHPGNLRIMEDGRLAFFDFGMVGHVTKEMQEKLVNTILHLIERNYEAVVQDFVLMGLLDKDFSGLKDIAKELQPIYDARFGHNKDINTSFNQVIQDLAHIVYKYPFKLPVEFALIIRALLVLEGVGHILDPKFNVIKALIPFVQTYVFTKEGTWLREHITDQVMKSGLSFGKEKSDLANKL